MTTPTETGFDAHGHVLEGAVREHLAGRLAPRVHDAIEAHLFECATCRDRVAQARQEPAPDRQISPSRPVDPARGAHLEPPASPASAVQTGRRWGPIAAGLGAVAVVALFLVSVLVDRSAPPAEAATPPARSGKAWFQVFREKGGMVQRLSEGSTVRPGDHLGFRVLETQGAHVLVFGVDGAGEVYPAWPPPPTTGSQWLDPAPDGHDLNSAVVLDDSPGPERLVAVRCPDELGYHLVVEALRAHPVVDGAPLQSLVEGCLQSELRLKKVAASP